MTLTRSEMLSRNKRRYKQVQLRDESTVRIQSLTNLEMRSFRNSLTDAKGDARRIRFDRAQELLIVRCMIDGEGQLLFNDDDATNGVFDQMDGDDVARIYHTCRAHCGFDADDDFVLIEDAVKNSSATTDNSSSSG